MPGKEDVSEVLDSSKIPRILVLIPCQGWQLSAKANSDESLEHGGLCYVGYREDLIDEVHKLDERVAHYNGVFSALRKRSEVLHDERSTRVFDYRTVVLVIECKPTRQARQWEHATDVLWLHVNICTNEQPMIDNLEGSEHRGHLLPHALSQLQLLDDRFVYSQDIDR